MWCKSISGRIWEGIEKRRIGDEWTQGFIWVCFRTREYENAGKEIVDIMQVLLKEEFKSELVISTIESVNKSL
jgi:hypothetical protein